jgi:hypothetical protein
VNRIVIFLAALVVILPSRSHAKSLRHAATHENDIALLQQAMGPLDEFDRAWKAYSRCAPDKGAATYAACGHFLEQARAAANRLASLGRRASVSPDYSVVQVKLVAIAEAWSSGMADYLAALKSGDSSLLTAAGAKAEEAVRLKKEVIAEVDKANERVHREQHLDVIRRLVARKGAPDSRACRQFSATTDDVCRRILAGDEDPRLRGWSVIELVCQGFDERIGPACRNSAFAEYIGSGADAATACVAVARWAGDVYQESCAFLKQIGREPEQASLSDACARTRRGVEMTLRNRCRR